MKDEYLGRATAEFVSVLQSGDPNMRAGREPQRQVIQAGKNAIVTTLNSESIFQGQTEVDTVVTVAHPQGILFIVLVAPESEAQTRTGRSIRCFNRCVSVSEPMPAADSSFGLVRRRE